MDPITLRRAPRAIPSDQSSDETPNATVHGRDQIKPHAPTALGRQFRREPDATGGPAGPRPLVRRSAGRRRREGGEVPGGPERGRSGFRQAGFTEARSASKPRFVPDGNKRGAQGSAGRRTTRG